MNQTLKAILLSQFLFLLHLPFAAESANPVLPGSKQPIDQLWFDRWQETNTGATEFINRLALSESVYLRQHADNPIDWYPWAEAAFSRAKTENKLIFLSIGYASCHWCHVMEAESFADKDVAIALNQAFVSIKVDREQLPDIDAYYTTVVETIKGESGWPMTVILTPDLKPVFAANYLDKSQLLTALQRLARFWQDNPDSLEQSASLYASEIEQRSQRGSQHNVNLDVAFEALAKERLLASIDTSYGGFGQGNKFPDELKLQFLLNMYKVERDEALKNMLVGQLDTLMNSGMNDLVFGGVFRYTTDRQMTRPHFEKMLYNQALTVSLFSDAANWLDKPDYRRYADSIIRFVDQAMQLEDGSYAAAVDADHEGREGGYYLWPASVLAEMPDDVSQVVFGDDDIYLYGPPLGAGKNTWRSRMQQSRSGKPRRIDNRITAWNALWVDALLQAGETAAAIKLADVLWASAWKEGQLYRMPGQPGFLDDYAYFSNSLWRLYLKTGNGVWKRRARLLDGVILSRFYQQGMLAYSNQTLANQFPVDVYQDKEMPGPLSAVLWSFGHHQTELEFIDAYETLRDSAYSAIGNRPEYSLSLLQQNLSFAESERIIANGHGVISLRPMQEPGQWQLTLTLDQDWHVNASSVFDEALIPFQVLSEENDLKIDYPRGQKLNAEFSDEPLNIYSEKVTMIITSPDTGSALSFQVKLQACSSEVCLLPELILLRAINTGIH